jgi:hypothetical protein
MNGNTVRDLPYGLLDQDTGNFVGFFETEMAALAAVADSIARYGHESAEALALARFVGNDVIAVAEGGELTQRALATGNSDHHRIGGAAVVSDATTAVHTS